MKPYEHRQPDGMIMNRSLNIADGRALKSISTRPPEKSPSARRKTASFGSLAFSLMIAAALATGWIRREQLPTAEAGIGYYIGIMGGVSMLALLLYPMRKHAPFMRNAGTVAFWFRTHMALGLIGPTLILYHAKFSFGSINANVALVSMLIVAGGGLVGRIFYAKIHKGLYGVKADLRNLAAEAADFRSHFSADLDARLTEKFDRVERGAFENSPGMGKAAVKMMMVTAAARSLHADLQRRMKKGPRGGKDGVVLRARLEFYDRYFRRVEQAAELGFYERLFAAWHLFHLPLFILLILTAIVHVVAVHLY